MSLNAIKQIDLKTVQWTFLKWANLNQLTFGLILVETGQMFKKMIPYEKEAIKKKI